jgi:uncharacterized protein (TIGR03435 family)
VTLVERPKPPPTAATPAAQSSLTPTSDLSAATNVQISETSDTLTGSNLSLADLLSVAYRTPENPKALLPLLSSQRVIVTPPLAEGRYDIRVYVPGGSAERLRAVLRKALLEKFNLSARRELRDAAVLVLKAPAGQLVRAAPRGDAVQTPGTRRMTLTGSDLALLAEQLEERMQRPVVNETRLAGDYALVLEQVLADGALQPLELAPVRAALREQLGLDLIAAHRTIEFIVVQKGA